MRQRNALIVPTVPHMLYGGDYNPEQWPENVWLADMRLMREAGVTLVSVGIESWSRLEPRPGEYDVGWLDRVLDLLHAHGVKADLATATATPPPWLGRLYPESLPVTADGVTLWPGGRQQYCPSSVAYRERASALVRHIAERYRAHPALALWHVNNEYGCHVAHCYCDASAVAFRAWLERRYGTIERLNAAWETAFWSQRYDSWEEINPPRRVPAMANPTQRLDFARFSSNALLDLFAMERAILDEVTPDIPVTTNFMGFWKSVDYWAWAPHQSIVSHDSYPDPADPAAHVGAAMECDLMRSLGQGSPWLLMEQTPSTVNWRPHNIPKQPGQMRLWSLQAVARGADGIMFFQWRASKAGAEKFHGAMLPHVGTDSRVWREVVALGADLAKLDAVLGARVPAEVAILFDWESWWALEIDAIPSVDVGQMDQLARYYAPLYDRNIPVDFVRPDGDLAGYKVVLAPNLYLAREGAGANLERFVARGGRLVMSFFSGIVDEEDHVLLGGYPAPFRALLGIRVEEFVPYVPGQANTLTVPNEGAYACDLWADVINLEGAEALARFDSGYDAGRPAVTRHVYGRGESYYLGTRPDVPFLARLLARVCREAGIAGIPAPEGVEAVRRVDGATSILFALNHTTAPVDLPLERPGRDLLTGALYGSVVPLGPRDAVVLRETVQLRSASCAGCAP